MDAETKALRRVLLERRKLRARLVETDRTRAVALRTWSDSRPGCRGGIATEAGAGFLLAQMGVL